MEAGKAVGDSVLLAPFLVCPFPPLARAGDPQATGEERATRRGLLWADPCSVCKEGALLSSFHGGLGSLKPSSQRLPCLEHKLR